MKTVLKFQEDHGFETQSFETYEEAANEVRKHKNWFVYLEDFQLTEHIIYIRRVPEGVGV